MINLLQEYLDIVIFIILGFMSFLLVWKTIERILFYRSVNIQNYKDEHLLNKDLTNSLSTIGIIASNAPYIGLLGTVFGIILTFFQIGESGGHIDASKIMISLSLALKATGLGIMVSIPAMIVYSICGRKVEELQLLYKSILENK